MANRYQAQIILPEIGHAGQSKLAAAKVLCIGCGGLAASVLPYLAAAGVGEITLIDDDIVNLSNLNRQILFHESDVGKFKARVVADYLKRQNPAVQINTRLEKFSLENGTELVKQHDLILDCCDDYQTKLVCNYCCGQANTPWVYASVLGWDGQVALFRMQNDDEPCYKCWQHKAPQNLASCSLSGVLGAAVNVVGSFQASLALQALLGEWHNAHQLFIFDLWHLEQQKFSIKRLANCKFHQTSPTNLGAWQIKYEQINSLVKPLLIDIRSAVEWERGHLPKARHLPIAKLMQQAPEYLADNNPIVIYCNQQTLSNLAAENLRELGYNQVYVLAGGYSATHAQIAGDVEIKEE